MKKIITILVMAFSFLSNISGQETSCSMTDIQHTSIVFTLNRVLPISEFAFSITDSTKVLFALGNLQYKPSTDEWRFAPRQFDYVGGGYGGDGGQLPSGEYGTIYENGVKCWNIKYDNPIRSSHAGWIDAFGFEEFPYTEIVVADKTYRVLTKAELEYIVKHRTNAGQLRARAQITLNEPTPDGNTFVNGILLLPDNWNPKIPISTTIIPDLDGVTGCWYYYDNIITENEWYILEAQGAVFLPAAGNPTGRTNSKYNRSGFYWTSSPGVKVGQSMAMEFGGYPYNNQNSTPSFQSQNKTYRRSFRLCRDVKVVTTPDYSCAEYDSAQIHSNGGTITATQDLIEKCNWGLNATPTNGYKFANWKSIHGVLSYEPNISVTLDSAEQNALWQVTFVRDNAFIDEWASDSVILRADTTDILSHSQSNGKIDVCINDSLIERKNVRKFDHGIWSSNITSLTRGNVFAGDRFHMVIYNYCNEVSAVIDSVVPVVINGDSLASNLVFPSCDVQVFDGAKLTIDKNTVISGYLDIHEGGTVIVNSGKSLTVGGIILRGNGIRGKWAQLLVEGRITNNNSNVIYYDYTLNSKEYYPLTLPVTVLCQDLTNAVTGGVPSFVSYTYNTEKRNTGVSAWEEYDDLADGASYEAGKGYLIYAAGIKWKGEKSLRQQSSKLRFPLVMDLSEYGEEEKFTYIYSNESEGIEPIHKNWNFIGNPYLCNFKIGSNTSDTAKITQGYYELVGDHYEIVNTGEGTLRYITYSLDGYRSYIQERVVGFTMKPFNSYFVQTSYGNVITFNKADIIYHAPRRLQKDAVIKEIETGIILRQGNVIDRIGLLFGDFTSDYDINADLYKEIGREQPMSAYSLIESNPMAFQALPYNVNTEKIRVGYQRAQLDEMTFSFDDEWYERKLIDKIWLTDTETGKVTNLMLEDYTFLPKSKQDNSRFYLSIILNNGSNIPTDLETNNNTEKKVISIYDVLGNRIDKEINKGVYIILNNDGTVRKEIK